ncbi:MAG TPA: ABC transporter ATP-binding protein [Spirochaetota bacterium]|jgi:oligopeptide/dipeptide ABC transporter ATP-binding protein|nr:ABC transporter ATP-binding protein [Spirochaetota bacterium]OQA94937.1 MAG: Oligopeptide transport ATP-binding protein OppD [Spirochaetes bacterium ADurb.Bin218]HON15825.1 ABC transporter ATP-binding protein [Spirochaetota bacterium]HOQ12053.1 ABC transporter ATP-binding protein [Spirochaetota bacterium]HOV09894.1 ABC transporter ATP-binding protein [Spirochaetota bacterium]
MENNKFLDIKGLNVSFYTQKGVVRAVRDLDLWINKGETLALVGESGCGKSVTASSIIRLIPSPPGKIESGEIFLDGQDILKLSEEEMQKIRGDKISMIFQDPMTSLNPVFKIGDQIAEIFITHYGLKKKEALERAVEMLDMVKIPSPEKRVKSYPHQLSGGMRQRVMIAMALASPHPGIMIADEPTTALDVTIQAQILDLMKELQEKIQMSLLLITHDMGVVAEMASRVAVMYAGRKVESADVYSIFEKPFHPYTVGLLNSMPSNEKYKHNARLEAIEGNVPNLLEIGDGCPFENRCKYAKDICRNKFPEIKDMGNNHHVWCHFAGELNF